MLLLQHGNAKYCASRSWIAALATGYVKASHLKEQLAESYRQCQASLPPMSNVTRLSLGSRHWKILFFELASGKGMNGTLTAFYNLLNDKLKIKIQYRFDAHRALILVPPYPQGEQDEKASLQKKDDIDGIDCVATNATIYTENLDIASSDDAMGVLNRAWQDMPAPRFAERTHDVSEPTARCVCAIS